MFLFWGKVELGKIELLNYHSDENILFKYKNILDFITLKL